jgi:hypothetical protein
MNTFSVGKSPAIGLQWRRTNRRNPPRIAPAIEQPQRILIDDIERHSGARKSANPESRADDLGIPGSARSLSSGGAERRPVGAAPE